MKAKIHPNYIEDQKITCACGNVILAGSTKKELKTEICSACHPFYTGHQKLLDTAGRVDKFMAKVKKAQKIKEKKVKVVDGELNEIIHAAEATEAEEAPKSAEAVQTGFLTEEASPEIKKAVKAKAAKKAAKKPAAAKKAK